MTHLYHAVMAVMGRDTLLSSLAAHLAANLRYTRQRRGLTQAQLASLCGLPRSTVAQIETGSGNPTLGILARIAGALHLSIEELLSAPHARCQLFVRGSLPSEARGRGTALVSKLLPDPIPGMEIDRIELQPGGRMTGIPHRPGTREYLTCEQGRLTLRAAGERYDLSKGDVAAFQGDQPHSYHNGGKTPAVGFSVVTLAPLPVAGRGAPLES
jgi:transcriptional regulator with XRE-family HTH domain